MMNWCWHVCFREPFLQFWVQLLLQYFGQSIGGHGAYIGNFFWFCMSKFLERWFLPLSNAFLPYLICSIFLFSVCISEWCYNVWLDHAIYSCTRVFYITYRFVVFSCLWGKLELFSTGNGLKFLWLIKQKIWLYTSWNKSMNLFWSNRLWTRLL